MIGKLISKLDKKLIEHDLRRQQEYEKQVREQEEWKRKEEWRADVTSRVQYLDRFSGNLEDYCSLKGEEYGIIDTETPIKEVLVDLPSCDPWVGIRSDEALSVLEKLLEKGCSGFIYWHPIQTWEKVHYGGGESSTYTSFEYRGVPVRLSKQSSAQD